MLQAEFSRELNTSRETSMAFAAAPDFSWTQHAVDAPRDLVTIDARLNIVPDKASLFYADVSIQSGQDFKSISGKVGFRYSW